MWFIQGKMVIKLVPTFQKLSLAECDEMKLNEFEYNGGSKFIGKLVNNSKQGCGVFKWMNGDVYVGDFMNDRRHGRGAQQWSDGSSYEGDFFHDRRHGRGLQKWSTGESYEGEFRKDMRQGNGIYRWPDGSSLEGWFARDAAEGYCALVKPGTGIFDGLYKDNEREGPGVLSYEIKDNEGVMVTVAQDVGLWHREFLVFLCVDSRVDFSLRSFSEFNYDPADYQLEVTCQYDDVASLERLRALTRDALIGPFATDTFVYDAEFVARVTNDLPLQRESAFETERRRLGSAASARKSASSVHRLARTPQVTWEQPGTARTGEDSEWSGEQYTGLSSRSGAASAGTSLPHALALQPTTLRFIAVNPTPLLVEIQKHSRRFADAVWKYQSVLSIERLLDTRRDDFKPTGTLERDSLALINAAFDGDRSTVAALLKQGNVHASVADRRGITPIFAAAIRWNVEVINLLLDNGADVNALTNERVSPISACVLQFYKMAERLGPKPAGHRPATPSGAKKERAAQRVTIREPPASDVAKPKRKVSESGQPKDAIVPKPPAAPQSEKRPAVPVKAPEGLQASTEQLERVVSKKKAEKDDDSEADDSSRDSLSELEDAELFNAAMLAMMAGDEQQEQEQDTQAGSLPHSSDFASSMSVTQYPVNVNEVLIERCATEMSMNEQIVKRSRMSLVDPSVLHSEGTMRELAMRKSEMYLCDQALKLLLKRGADPNASNSPMPILFFAVKAADVSTAKLFLEKGANPNATLLPKMGGYTALHSAAMLEGDAGPKIVEMLLNALADPDARANPDGSYEDLIENPFRPLKPEDMQMDKLAEPLRALTGGRSPLHIACERDRDFENSTKIVRLLLAHKSSPNVLCNGHTPLTLAIINGNDAAISALLQGGADPNLPLTHGLGNALWIAVSLEVERRRPDLASRMEVMNTLVKHGADMLIQYPVGPKRHLGTVVDAAFYSYSMDRRIAHTPFHALGPEEREVYINRQQFLAHVATLLREQAVRQRELLLHSDTAAEFTSTELPEMAFNRLLRKSAFRYCYECGRSVYVRLVACTRCREVYFCGKSCKQKAWVARHKDECARMSGEHESRAATPTTYAERRRPPASAKPRQPEPPMKGRSQSASRNLKLPPLGSRRSDTYTVIADKYYKMKLIDSDGLLRRPSIENYSFT